MVRVLVALPVVIILAGCSLVNPYVVNREVREGRRADGTPAVVDHGRMTFKEAREYAGRVKEQYRGALVDQAQLNPWLGIGLIPLSAAAMGLGASGGPATGVLALGLTGGAAYGTATWLSNRPRQAAYESVKATVERKVPEPKPQGDVRDPSLSDAENQARERAVQEADRRYGELAKELKTLRDERCSSPSSAGR